MDILAGIFAYVAGLGVLFAGVALSFFVFFSAPHGSLQTQTQQQNASAMLVRPSTPHKHATIEARAKESAKEPAKQSAKQSSDHSEKRDFRRNHAASTAQARRLIEEERARRWAYQQEPSFEGRFLGYAD